MNKEKQKEEHMSNIDAKAYSELFEIINLLDESEKNKIPTKIYENIKSQKSKEYINQYNTLDDINENNIEEKTAILLTSLYLDYIANDEEKKEVEDVLKENEKQLSEKYSTENMFKNRNKEENTQKINTMVTIKKKETVFTKILNKIKSLFKKR